MATINLKLLDVDGCLYRPVGYYSEKTIENWLIDTNQEFLKTQAAEIQASQYKKVIIAYGTNRQDRNIDLMNSDRGGSCAPVLPLWQSALDNLVDCEVVIDTFLMADTYGSKTAGASYEAILKANYCNIKDGRHAEWVFDHTKISLIYAHAHRVAMLHPGDEIVIDFYDDRTDLLSGIYEFFNQHPDLLPDNVTLRLKKYNGNPVEAYNDPIKGAGIVDANYDWTVRYMATKPSAGNHWIKSAKDLVQHHKDYDKRIGGKPMEMRVDAFFDVDKFKQFRKNEIPTLQSDPKITRAANYTTAAALLEKGLIKKEFAVPAQEATVEKLRALKNKVEPVLESASSSQPSDDDISARLHQRIIAEISSYINSRAKSNNQDQLGWVTRHFRNTRLTTQKIIDAKDFLTEAKNTRSFSRLCELIKECENSNKSVEENFAKTYTVFTKSGLARNLNNIKRILNSTKENSNEDKHMKKFN